MEHEHLNYYEALKWLAEKYHIEIAEHNLSSKEIQSRNLRESLFVLNDFARDYFQESLYSHSNILKDNPSDGLSYLRRRGFSDELLRKFQVGYSPSQNDALYSEANRKGYSEPLLLQSGLCYKSNHATQPQDRFSGRIVFPIHTLSGKIAGFGARLIHSDTGAAKYLNSPESEIYHKSNELFGLYQARQAIVKADCCYLVEGYTDVLAMHRCGIENVAASSGTSLTPGQIRMIHRFTEHVTLVYDGDAPGIQASLRGIDLLLQEGMQVNAVLLPDGDDPDSFVRTRVSGTQAVDETPYYTTGRPPLSE